MILLDSVEDHSTNIQRVPQWYIRTDMFTIMRSRDIRYYKMYYVYHSVRDPMYTFYFASWFEKLDQRTLGIFQKSKRPGHLKHCVFNISHKIQVTARIINISTTMNSTHFVNMPELDQHCADAVSRSCPMLVDWWCKLLNVRTHAYILVGIGAGWPVIK